MGGDDRSQPGFELRVLQQMQDAIYPAWWRSAIDDLLWPSVTHSGPEQLKDVSFLHKYFDLCLKQSTRQLAKLQQKGEFNPLFFLVRLDLLPPIQLQFSELKVADSI